MGKSPLEKALAAVTGQGWVCKGTGIIREPRSFSNPDMWLTAPPGLLITHHTTHRRIDTGLGGSHACIHPGAWAPGTLRQAWEAGLWPHQMRLAMLDVVS